MANQQFSEKITEKLADYRNRFRKNKRLKRISAVVAICAVTAVTVALVLPAATLEFQKPVCGMEEHTHTDECYTKELTCALPATGVHVHGNACYDDAGELVCEKPATGHFHTDGCYEVTEELTCTNADPAHVHEAACYTQTKSLVCDEEETVHIHDASCFDEAGALICQSDAAHVHGDTCYTMEEQVREDGTTVMVPVLTCDLPCAGHVHCSACYDEAGQLICGQVEEILVDHEHDDSCYTSVLTCDKVEHVHDDLCYDEITQSAMKADAEKQEAAENGAVVESEGGIVIASPEAAIPVDELDTLKTEGFVFENDDMILAVEAPDDIKDRLELNIGVKKDNEGALSAQDASGDAVDTADTSTGEAAQTPDAATDAPDATDAAEGAEDATTQSDEPVTEDEPVWVSNLLIEATLDGKPVDNIATLGLKARLQMKSSVIEPILADIDYEEVVPEIKDSFGAELSITQTANNAADQSISEREEDQVDEIIITDADEATIAFDVASNEQTVTATAPANPKFSVSYVAMLDTVIYSSQAGDDVLRMIDTSGGVLPTNQAAKNNTLRSVYIKLDKSGNKYQVKTERQEHAIFTDETYNYIKAPNLSYFNKVYENSHYKLTKVDVKQPGASTYTSYDPATVHFTNKQATADANPGYILIKEGTDIKLVYEVTTDVFDNDVSFYDYDITDGKIYSSNTNAINRTNGQNTSTQTNATVYVNTTEFGINSPSNYVGSGSKYSFGNANAGVNESLSGAQVGGFNINKANATNSNNPSIFQKGSYGIVKGINSETGGIVFSDGIIGPDIFGNTDAIGKTVINGNHSMTFNRSGDTYEISSVSLNGSTAVSGLNTFRKSSGAVYGLSGVYQYMNGFFPLDSAITFGADGHDLKFGSASLESKRKRQNNQTLPIGDDGLDHNSYFGMQSQVNFNLLPDYIGPLDYYFFGDDDMWVFLGETDVSGNMIPGTEKLVCDIGGVHQTTGEYVNLRDYLPNGSSGNYALRFYFTERGASDSTCYMRFTLPSVSNSTLEQDTGTIRVEKQVTAPEGSDAYNKEFEFSIGLTDAAGNQLQDDYSYTRYNSEGKEIESNIIIWNGGSFRLKNGEYVIIRYLPVGSKYTIQEKGTVKADGSVEPIENDLYDVTYEYLENDKVISSGQSYRGQESPTYTGTIQLNDSATLRKLVYTNDVPYKLPETGGIGVYWYWFGGTLLVIFAIIAFGVKRRKQAVSAGFAPATSLSLSGRPECSGESERKRVFGIEGHARRGGSH